MKHREVTTVSIDFEWDNENSEWTSNKDNLLYDTILNFHITGKIYPYYPATWENPAEGGDIEIYLIKLLDYPGLEYNKFRQAIENFFWKELDNNKKLNDYIEELLVDEANAQEEDYPEYDKDREMERKEHFEQMMKSLPKEAYE